MEKLPTGFYNGRNIWKTFNKLRESVAPTKKNLHKWEYNAKTVDYDCGNKKTKQHIPTNMPPKLYTRRLSKCNRRGYINSQSLE